MEYSIDDTHFCFREEVKLLPLKWYIKMVFALFNEDRFHPIGVRVLKSKDIGCMFVHKTPI